MHFAAITITVLIALTIIAIGGTYVLRPRAATPSFGLPLPPPGPSLDPWLRLKGVRDIASGVAVLSILASNGPHDAGVILLALTLIPFGDMLTILQAGGSTRHAIGVHGTTVLLMIAAGLALLVSRA